MQTTCGTKTSVAQVHGRAIIVLKGFAQGPCTATDGDLTLTVSAVDLLPGDRRPTLRVRLSVRPRKYACRSERPIGHRDRGRRTIR